MADGIHLGEGTQDTDGKNVDLPTDAFPGIDPYSYEDREVFFARSRDIRSLVRLVGINRGVLLYAPSGVGKSSLINAGLFPEAIKEGYWPVRIRVQPLTDQEFIVESPGCCEPGIVGSWLDGTRTVCSVSEFEEQVRRCATESRPLLVFDQFEEWVTLFEGGSNSRCQKDRQSEIISCIARILRDRSLPVKILLALREDYLAKLTPLFHSLPELAHQHLRLQPVQVEELDGVVRGPFDRFPSRFHPEIPSDLAEAIRDDFAERSAADSVNLTEVQIVCRDLIGKTTSSEEMTRRFGESDGVKGILEAYLENALDDLESDQRDPAEALLSRMITSAGTRNVISTDDLLSRVEIEEEYSRELLGETLEKLETSARLVRKERRREVYYHEIVSEFLVSWIQRSAAQRQIRAEREKRIEAQRSALEDRKMLARWRRVVTSLVCAIFLALAFSVVAGIFIAKASKERQAREAAQIAALSAEAVQKLDDEPLQSLRRSARANTLGLRADVRIAAAADSLRRTLSVVGGRALVIDGRPVVGISLDRSGRWMIGTQDGLNGWVLWDTGSAVFGAEAMVIKGEAHGSLSWAVDHNGHWFAAVDGDRKIRMWNLKELDSGSKVISEKGDENTKLEFSPHTGNLLVRTGDTVQVWDPTTTSHQPRSEFPEDSVRDAVFDPSHDRIAIVGSSGAVRIEDLGKGGAVQPIPPEQGSNRTFNAEFSRSGDRLAAWARLNESVWIWNSVAGGPPETLMLNEFVQVVAFSPDDRLIAIGGQSGRVVVFEVDALNEPPIFDLGLPKTVWALEFSPDAQYLAIGCLEETIRLASLTSDGKNVEVLHGHESRVADLRFSPDGRRLISLGYQDPARIWIVKSPMAEPRVLSAHDGPVTGLAWLEDPERVVSTGYDGAVRVWDAGDLDASTLRFGHELLSGSPSQRIYALADYVSEASKWLAAGDDAGTLRIWDAESDPPGLAFQFPGEIPILDIQAKGNAAGQTLIVVRDDRVEVLESESDDLRTTSLKTGERQVEVVAVNDSCSIVVAGGDDGTTLMWRRVGGAWETKPHSISNEDGHNTEITAMDFAPGSEHLLATGDRDGRVCVWDLQAEIPHLLGHGREGDSITSLSFDPSGDWLVSGDQSGLIAIFSLVKTPQQPLIIAGHESAVTGLEFSTDEERKLASSGRDGVVHLWDWQALAKTKVRETETWTVETIAETLVDGASVVTSVRFSPDGRWIAAASEDGSIRVWRTDAEELLTAACAVVGKNLIPKGLERVSAMDSMVQCLDYPPAQVNVTSR